MAGSTLRDPESVAAFLETYAESVGANRLSTAASRFCYHTMRPMLRGPFYLLARWNARFDVDLEGITYEEHRSAETGHEWGVQVREFSLEPVASREREPFRDETIETLLDDHYRPVFEALVDVTGIGHRVLWENLAHVLALYYTKWIEEAGDSDVRERFETDLRRMHDRVIGSMQNPLAEHFRSYALLGSDGEEFVRTSCCLNYRLERYCDRCPLPDAD